MQTQSDRAETVERKLQGSDSVCLFCGPEGVIAASQYPARPRGRSAIVRILFKK